ncbi:hypothetical protein [Microbacterium yannicii]|uniref:hypothetical protein n=1 Tax=Microbacterium yannicii TaxID=671622 RepID=UPI0012FBAB4F|nr:hypothetical protein [Microbacterium yannicii]
MPSTPDLSSLASRAPDLPSADELRSRATEAVPEASDAARSASDTLTRAGQALSTAGEAATAGAPDNVEQLVRKLYGPLVRRIKAELLLDRERRGIRIDGI